MMKNINYLEYLILFIKHHEYCHIVKIIEHYEMLEIEMIKLKKFNDFVNRVHILDKIFGTFVQRMHI